MVDDYILWILTFAYAAHAFEERILDWKSWALKTFSVEVSWENFYCANFTVVVLGICCSSVGWKYAAFSLSLPALALINAIFFHILPAVIKKSFSPGIITSIFLFLPLGYLSYRSAGEAGVLSPAAAIISLLSGSVIMAFPFILLRIKRYIDRA